MNRLTEGTKIHDIVHFEEPNYSRDDIVIASGEGELAVGTILEKTNTGKYAAVDITVENEGQENEVTIVGTPAAILLTAVDATSADVKAIGLTRFATVIKSALVFKNTLTDEQKEVVYDGLISLGIVIREGV
jgi:hypothetical protein